MNAAHFFTSPATLADFRVGDHLVFLQRSKRGEERRTAIVTAVNYNGLGGVTFTDRPNADISWMTSGSGWFDPTKIGTKPFGFYCAVEVVGHTTFQRQRYVGPRPGDTAYDLMC